MSNDNPFVIPEMDPSLRTQVQECNWQVVNVTTPANYFHVLRRQVSLFCVFLVLLLLVKLYLPYHL
jgi:2-oxoglutarate dehydrogenase E1 component